MRSQMALDKENNSISDEVRSIDLNKEIHSSRIMDVGAGARTLGGASARNRNLLSGVEGNSNVQGSLETAYGRSLTGPNILEPTRSSIK